MSLHRLAQLFSPEGDTYLDFGNAIRTWYNELHKDQKDKQAKWQNNILHVRY